MVLEIPDIEVGTIPGAPDGGKGGPTPGAQSQDPGPDKFDESPVSLSDALKLTPEGLK